MRLCRLLLLAALANVGLVAGLVQAQVSPARPADEIQQRMDHDRRQKSDWEKEHEAREWREAEGAPPAFPRTKDGKLIEFPVSGASSFRFFIDPASLAVGTDGVVRYTLVARSPSGFENITYEGMRCGVPGTYKVFALGNDGRWSPARGEWREIEPRSVQRWHMELRSRYFCPLRAKVDTADEAVDALRRGGHPALANTGAGK
jgi:hypothetical protein